ncbi:MAG: hypothetical protein IPP07_13010, partial [Holophagales bacterium]|nr:hypothetical protein [Holophagales bacterium]
GLARSADSVSGLTATGTVMGTPSYMAPEQAMGKALDARADQYALACIAFEMLTGRVPFKADTPLAVLHQHVSVPPEPVTSFIGGLPPGVDDVLSRGLSKNAAQRYASCTELVSALAAVFGLSLGSTAAISSPVRAVPPPVPSQTGAPTIHGAPTVLEDPGQRPVADLPTVVTRDAAVISGGSISSPEARMAAAASMPPPPPVVRGKGPNPALLAVAALLVLGVLGGGGWFAWSRLSAGKGGETTPAKAAALTPSPSCRNPGAGGRADGDRTGPARKQERRQGPGPSPPPGPPPRSRRALQGGRQAPSPRQGARSRMALRRQDPIGKNGRLNWGAAASRDGGVRPGRPGRGGIRTHAAGRRGARPPAARGARRRRELVSRLARGARLHRPRHDPDEGHAHPGGPRRGGRRGAGDLRHQRRAGGALHRSVHARRERLPQRRQRDGVAAARPGVQGRLRRRRRRAGAPFREKGDAGQGAEPGAGLELDPRPRLRRRARRPRRGAGGGRRAGPREQGGPLRARPAGGRGAGRPEGGGSAGRGLLRGSRGGLPAPRAALIRK